jgi:hypothetical protein
MHVLEAVMGSFQVILSRMRRERGVILSEELVIAIKKGIDLVEVGIVEGLNVGFDTFNKVCLMSEDRGCDKTSHPDGLPLQKETFNKHCSLKEKESNGLKRKALVPIKSLEVSFHQVVPVNEFHFVHHQHFGSLLDKLEDRKGIEVLTIDKELKTYPSKEDMLRGDLFGLLESFPIVVVPEKEGHSFGSGLTIFRVPLGFTLP